MFYRKVADKDFEPATLAHQDTHISGRGKVWFVPTMDEPNEIEALFECAPDEVERIKAQGEVSWLFKGAATDDAGTMKYRVSVPVVLEGENASHTAPQMQLRFVWDGGDYQAEPSV
jgi:hypothetical protein